MSKESVARPPSFLLQILKPFWPSGSCVVIGLVFAVYSGLLGYLQWIGCPTNDGHIIFCLLLQQLWRAPIGYVVMVSGDQQVSCTCITLLSFSKFSPVFF